MDFSLEVPGPFEAVIAAAAPGLTLLGALGFFCSPLLAWIAYLKSGSGLPRGVLTLVRVFLMVHSLNLVLLAASLVFLVWHWMETGLGPLELWATHFLTSLVILNALAIGFWRYAHLRARPEEFPPVFAA